MSGSGKGYYSLRRKDALCAEILWRRPSHNSSTFPCDDKFHLSAVDDNLLVLRLTSGFLNTYDLFHPFARRSHRLVCHIPHPPSSIGAERNLPTWRRRPTCAVLRSVEDHLAAVIHIESEGTLQNSPAFRTAGYVANGELRSLASIVAGAHSALSFPLGIYLLAVFLGGAISGSVDLSFLRWTSYVETTSEVLNTRFVGLPRFEASDSQKSATHAYSGVRISESRFLGNVGGPL
ncbi:hypothetical protein B0H16DRAFT_1469641 [Mycena metata]|uniref:Uncharacterized protein n=1 Tax=Mycena metata TaxID=1033252 RepID=A0AAD7HXF6_9AGAR|nr:hypothetical protein B0H16DRAFT_1469641 [Mycena metata]